MRPLRLTMTAFGPYAGTEVVDFDALTDLGLFVVAGNNGSGKTTIFDALHYALYGTLPGRRASYIRLKSDHADDTTECQVTLDFAAHGKHWRVERSPQQKRSKRRGTGTTKAPAAATLFRLDKGTPTAITNRIEEVRAQCAELVGLSGKQFERVALLPQGQFSRVLTESSTERRELLRTLFSSEIFDNATSLLADAAAEATAADRAVLERLDHRQDTLAQELSTLTAQHLPNVADALHGAIADYQRVELASQALAVAELDTASQHAATALQAAITTVQRLERREQVQLELVRHEQLADQHATDMSRLHNARAAVPVAAHAQSLARHRDQRRVAQQRVVDLNHRLRQALAAAGLDQLPLPTDGPPDVDILTQLAERIDEFDALLTDRRDAALHLQDLAAVIARTQGELRRLTNEGQHLHEQHRLITTQQRQASTELANLDQAADIDECETTLRAAEAHLAQRSELAELETAHGQLVRRATDLDSSIERLEHARETAVQAQSLHASAQEKADTAFAAYEECERRSKALGRYQAATTALTAARSELTQARTDADRSWDAFIAGTAARVADALVDDEPCPVCGSCEHPEPAVVSNSGQVVTESMVAQARAHSEAMQAKVHGIEASIEALRTVDADIATIVATELAAQISTTKAMALGARTVADETRQAAAMYDQVEQELRRARNERTELDDELRSTDQRQNRLQGALGPVAHQPVAALRSRVADAATAREQADQLVERRAQLVQALTSFEDDLETIGLTQIATDSRRTSVADQLAAQQQSLEQATERCHDVDRAITAYSTTPVRPDHDLESRTTAARNARSLCADITTAIAREHDAIDAVRRAQSILDERLAQSPFDEIDQALASFVDPQLLTQLEAQTSAHIATGDRLHGQLHELADLPDTPPDVAAIRHAADQAAQAHTHANTALITATTNLERIAAELHAIAAERAQRQTADLDTRRLERVAALAKGDNERNTSFENWVLAAHLRDVVELANIRLARSTHQRFQLCVLDDGENKRGKWGLDLGVEDTVTGTQRPTAGLSGGELFQASLALALGLADAVMNQSAGVQVDALFIDEGFGSLDETSVERAIDLLDELRDRGAMVGVITHVPALLDALPLGVRVVESSQGNGSTIQQSPRAA